MFFAAFFAAFFAVFSPFSLQYLSLQVKGGSYSCRRRLFVCCFEVVMANEMRRTMISLDFTMTNGIEGAARCL